MPALIESIKDVNKDVSRAAVDALVRLAPPPKRPCRRRRSLNEEDLGTPRQSGGLVGKDRPGGANGDACADRGLSGFKQQRRGERRPRVGKIGPGASDAVPALIALVKDERSPFQETAIEALGEIGPEAKEAVPVLRKR